jgi:2-polyprenyl-3-methyl-5-hydroxy-6-metoxy-1,4-benzoquinol methylase
LPDFKYFINILNVITKNMTDTREGIRNFCPLCGKKREGNEVIVGGTTIICTNCSLIFNYALPSLNIEEKWNRYTFDPGVEEYDLARIQFFEYLWKYICQLTKKNTGRFLDFGCGRGILLKTARLNGWQAEGIETSEKISKIAENYSGCKVFSDRIENLNLNSESYDVISMIDVFRQLIDPMNDLKNCVELCKKGGKIIIRDLNISHPASLKHFSASQEWDLQCLSPETAKIFMEKAGIKNVYFLPSPISLLTTPFTKKILKNNSKINNKLMGIINKVIQMTYSFTFHRWLSITPEMLIIGEK